MASAEHVTKLQAVCAACGSPASRTQRLIDGEPAAFEDPIIIVGASESYEPRCRQFHADVYYTHLTLRTIYSCEMSESAG